MQNVASALRKTPDISTELINISITAGTQTVRAANRLLQDLADLRTMLEEEETAVREAEVIAASENLLGNEKWNLPLAVNYGSTEVTPGIRLERTQTSTIPTFNYRAPSSSEQTYTLLMVDLSIPSARVDPSELAPEQLPLAAGLGANRTTRLHFWQAGLTFSDNGTLVNTTEPVAFYNGPMPPAGDIPHDYVFYLFQQEAGFAPPPEDSPFNINNVNAASMNRMSFSVQRFAEGEGVGYLVAANYIQVQNLGSGSEGSRSSNGTAGPSATSSTTSATGGVAAPSPSPFTGSAGKLGARGVLGAMVVGSVVILLG
ncbi:MAG: hypothetical protein Q9184_003813 [Pyrenodesmia sp. 2 TL-2023]